MTTVITVRLLPRTPVTDDDTGFSHDFGCEL